MTTEEKARAYDEALNDMRVIYPNLRGDAKLAVEHAFPQLVESDDERIRKNLVELLLDTPAQDIISHHLELSKILDWFEKQKEQKTEIKYVYPIFKVGDTIKPKAYNESHQINKIKDDNYVLDNGFTFPIVGQDVWEIVDQKPAENSIRTKIISRATSEKQVVLLSESNGDAEIDWDTRSLEDAKKLLEHGIAFINKRLGTKPVEWSYPYGRNETVDRLFAIAQCLEMDNNCLFNGYSGTECGKFLRELARKQVEYKPEEWDDEDEKMRNALWSLLKIQYAQDYSKTCVGIEAGKFRNWLNSLPKDSILKSKQEWSEDYRKEDIQTRFAFYTYKDDPSTLYLSNVFVEESSRNHGLGTKILKVAEKVAETIGATTIFLKVKQNSPANAWYRKNGYDCVAFEDEYDWLEKNLEYIKSNKQEWSDEDKGLLLSTKCIIDEVWHSDNTFGYSKEELEEIWNWLNVAWTRLEYPKENNEWSEEDKKMLDAMIDIVSNSLYKPLCPREEMLAWLKSLRPPLKDKEMKLKILKYLSTRCSSLEFEEVEDYLNNLRSSWKPSEEQLDAVQYVSQFDYGGHKAALESLYEQLKKL